MNDVERARQQAETYARRSVVCAVIASLFAFASVFVQFGIWVGWWHR